MIYVSIPFKCTLDLIISLEIIRWYSVCNFIERNFILFILKKIQKKKNFIFNICSVYNIARRNKHTIYSWFTVTLVKVKWFINDLFFAIRQLLEPFISTGFYSRFVLSFYYGVIFLSSINVDLYQFGNFFYKVFYYI